MKDNPGAWLGLMCLCVWPLSCIVIGYTLGWRRWIPSWIKQLGQTWLR